MNFEFVKYEKRDRLALITLNRPEVMNALHPPCHEELERIFNDFAADSESSVAILTGAGDKAFSAGNDLKWTTQHGVPKLPKTGFGAITRRFDLVKPVIAAVNGFALGGGFEIALACDLIVAAEHARFGVPEPRVGLMAAAGGVHRLPRHIPLKIAMGRCSPAGTSRPPSAPARLGQRGGGGRGFDAGRELGSRDHRMLPALGARQQGSRDAEPASFTRAGHGHPSRGRDPLVGVRGCARGAPRLRGEA